MIKRFLDMVNSFEKRRVYRRTKSLREFWLVKYMSTLTLSLPEKLKSLIFQMPIIPQTFNINNSRTTGAKSINLHTIRKLIEYSLSKIWIKEILTPTVFEILISEGRLVLSPAQRCTGSKRVKHSCF